MSIEEYIDAYILHSDREPACEYVDGFLVPKAMGTRKHGRVAANLGYLILTHYRDRFRVSMEQHVRNRATRFRIPDIAVEVRKPEFGQYPEVDDPVYLCVEIVSPPDTVEGLLSKCRGEYHPWGVPYCWVLDPDTCQGWEYHAADPQPREVTSEGQITAGEITFQLSDVFYDL
jgi:Uma2 family endonuclease